MRILKKSLACLLVAIIAATAMFGCLVSADTIAGTIYVQGVTVESTVETVDVSVTVMAESAISVARLKLNVPAALGTIESAAVVGEGVKAFETDVEDDDYNLATGTFLVEANDWEAGFTYAEVILTIALADDVAVGTYAIEAQNITEVEGADWSENPCTFTITNGEVEITGPLGSETNPYVLQNGFPRAQKAVNVEIPAGGAVYVKAYNFAGFEVGADFDCAISVTGALATNEELFIVTNNSDVAVAGLVKVLDPIGAKDNPEVIEAGDHTATIAEGSDGYYYTYTATADGTVKVTMPTDKGWVYVINNLTAATYGDTQWSDSDPVVNPGTVEVAKDDVLEIMVNTYDPASPWTAPAGEINWNLTLEEPVVGIPVDNTIVFKDKIVNIGACLEFRFRITKSTVSEDYDSIDFVVIPTKYDTAQNNAFNEVVLEPIVLPDEGKATGNYYTYWYRDIAMFELGLNITAYMRCYKDGEVVATSEILDIVPADYLIETQYVTVGATQKVKTIIADLLNMGAKAQTYFGASYTSSKLYSDIFDAEGKVIEANLVNARIDQADASTTYDELLSENTTTWGANNPLDASQYRMKASLVASKSPTITYRIYKGTTLDADKMSLTITYVSNSGETKTFTKTGADMYANGTSLYYDCVDLAYYDSDVTVTTRFDYDGVEVWTNVYSVSAGVNELLGSATGTLADLLNSIAIFGTSARVYTGYGA